jgi:hypothetical protein
MESPKSWQRFWWPKVDTPENAASAAKNGAVAFGFIALPYVIFAFVGDPTHYASQATLPPDFHGFDNRLSPPDTAPVLLVIALIAVRAAWRTYTKPSLFLCASALIWVLLEWALVALNGAWSDFIRVYWAQILGTVAGVGGVRGAWAARRFRHLAPEDGVAFKLQQRS